MRNLRYIVRLIAAFFARFKGLLLVGVGIGIGVFFVFRFLVPMFFGKSVERIGVQGRYHPDELPEEITGLIGDGLTAVDEQGRVVGALAKDWEVKDDGREWVFYLDEGKVWQDGKDVVAEDVVYNFEDVKTTYLDERTIVFELEDAFSAFGSIVSRPVFKRGLLGTGEWEVVRMSLVGGYVEKLVLENSQKARKIIRFYPSQEALRLAFELGEIERLVDMVDPSVFEDWNTTVILESVRTDRFVAVFFNTSDPLLGDKSVRQALSYGVDKSKFDGPRALGPISPRSWAFNPQVKEYKYDLNRAKGLLDDLPDELKEKPVVITTTPALLEVAEGVAEDWAKLGLKTQVQVVSVVPQQYQAFVAIYDIGADPDQYATWHSTQEGSNISKYQNPRIDKLLEDGRTQLDEVKRKKIYLDFQRFLLEDAPAAFLYHPVSYEVVRK